MVSRARYFVGCGACPAGCWAKADPSQKLHLARFSFPWLAQGGDGAAGHFDAPLKNQL